MLGNIDPVTCLHGSQQSYQKNKECLFLTSAKNSRDFEDPKKRGIDLNYRYCRQHLMASPYHASFALKGLSSSI